MKSNYFFFFKPLGFFEFDLVLVYNSIANINTSLNEKHCNFFLDIVKVYKPPKLDYFTFITI